MTLRIDQLGLDDSRRIAEILTGAYQHAELGCPRGFCSACCATLATEQQRLDAGRDPEAARLQQFLDQQCGGLVLPILVAAPVEDVSALLQRAVDDAGGPSWGYLVHGPRLVKPLASMLRMDDAYDRLATCSAMAAFGGVEIGVQLAFRSQSLRLESDDDRAAVEAAFRAELAEDGVGKLLEDTLARALLRGLRVEVVDDSPDFRKTFAEEHLAAALFCQKDAGAPC